MTATAGGRPRVRPRSARLAAALVLGVISARCGGGGGGSSSDSLYLTDVKYGRLVDDGSGKRLVSPLTTVKLDPVTGLVVPGSVAGLTPDVDVASPQTFAIGADYLPRVVPRNGVLQLEFSAAIDAASIVGDVLDGAGGVLRAGSIQVRREDGRGIAVALIQAAPNVVWVDPTVASGVGFPPSPVDFAPDGSPRADATGFLKLILPPAIRDKSGQPILPVLKSASGATLGLRSDRLGDSATPIGFNPGNRVLDFIVQNQLIPTGETFNGYLPDVAPPRIVRTLARSHTLAFASGDGATASEIDEAGAAFSTLANHGSGEWAGARLTLRPGLADQEIHTVLSNARSSVTIAGAFTMEPQDGDDYLLERSESFEPDPSDPIDPATFDPDDPEIANNTELVNFVEAYEIDAVGNAVNGPLTLRGALPPFSELRVRFSEPVSVDSLGAYENFRVVFDPDQGPGSEILSEVVLDPAQTTATIRPALEDPAGGTIRVVGWGQGIASLRFNITTVPRPDYLQQRMTSSEVAQFLDQGFRSVVDLGGQPLAFPDSLFSVAQPVMTYSVPFTSDESRSTQSPPPVVASFGVIVHRMQGRPITGVDPDTGIPGVKYVDQPKYYSPIADVNLQVNGYLAGSPIVYLTKIHDDEFPPPHGQFGAYPLGSATPLMSYNTNPGPQPHDGARFQTVYRDIDASPSRDALQGTLLDLYRLSWAPIGGNVTTDTYQDISIHCAHSPMRPMTSRVSGTTDYPRSGLGQPFDFDSWKSLCDLNIPDACGGDCRLNEGPNYWDSLVTVVLPGTVYKVTQSSLFSPPFDSHPYCPWPSFDVPFQYNNGDIPQAERDLRAAMNAAYYCVSSGNPDVWLDRRQPDPNPDKDNLGGDSLLVEYRIRPQSTNISRQNGFTFAIGVLLTANPKFRVFSVGAPQTVVNPDDIVNDSSARCAIGVALFPSNDVGNGDNDRYFATFDYVKTTSIIRSPFVRIHPATATSPDYFAPVILPRLADEPAGTQTQIEFEGADSVVGGGATGYSTDVNVADGHAFVAFRATFVGNVTTLLLPNFDLIAIPYQRP
jgi:hypothetical protein